MKIAAPKNFWAGLMFIAFGVGFALIAQELPDGHLGADGPGLLPDRARRPSSPCSVW